MVWWGTWQSMRLGKQSGVYSEFEYCHGTKLNNVDNDFVGQESSKYFFQS